jgi:N-methylhydantoinase A
MATLIGVDIGGTFTDILVSADGALRLHKLLSTPAEPARAMLTGLAAVGMPPEAQITHGSTVATNAILERTGARTALITTQGFRDLLAIGRQARPDLYALHPQVPPPLIPRAWCYEVPERLDHTGQVLIPLDLVALDAVLDEIAAQPIEAVAVCLLYSYLNPAHERAIRDRLVARGLFQPEQIALSSDVLPEFREFERASTTALDAYVRPIVSRYLTAVEEGLVTPNGARPQLLIMKSDGGVVRAATARGQAVQTALSGPAAGVIGAAHLAHLAGFTHIITLDVGGTSTDVALCPGAPARRTETQIDGLPVHMPLIDIETVGAGGGSLARVDPGGALRVGPASAGAQPGPIIYGRGGTQVTVSDANAALGRLDPDHFLDGSLPLQLAPALAAIDTLAHALGLSRAEAALGIIDVANVTIQRAIRRISVERGYDPRDFTLVAFGGAGPLHACEVAAALGLPRVLIPRFPGVLCALGLLVADVVRSASRTMLGPATPATLPAALAAIAEMVAQGQRDLVDEGIAPTAITCEATFDLRYQGQSYALTVPATVDAPAAFHQAHEQRYGFALPERAVELVTLRVRATGTRPKPDMRLATTLQDPVAAAQTGTTRVITHAGELTVPWHLRAALAPDATIVGPCLLFQMDTTTYVPAEWQGRVDDFGNLLLHHELSTERKVP